jgi:uncharacterized sulfatase
MKTLPCLLVPLVLPAAVSVLHAAAASSNSLPNILWLTAEDHGPHLGCYGDAFATTPNLDALARRGMIYQRAWSVAPVCAPARTAIISGMYPEALGAQHMRSLVPPPAGFQMYPQLLRGRGYYCTNNRKEDYNLEKPGTVWDESSPKAHWRNRPAEQPFFAVFNFENTHESRVRKRPHTFVHDPARVTVPPYHPDTPEVRQGWAQYYDQLTEADARAGEMLTQLEADALADNTIVFYFADHGPGLPRGKRTACNSGLSMPLIVHFPDKWRHLAPKEYAVGGASQRLVSFVDLAPTLVSLAGQKPPEWMQGLAFAGAHQTLPPKYRFGGRGRMDERYDLVRTVTDGRYVYVRNFMPHRPHGQHVAYLFETPTTQVWKRLYDEGKLNAVQSAYWQPRVPEELYDLRSDPYETRNLAADPAHRAAVEELRAALRRHLLEIRDVCLLPEAEMLARADSGSPRDYAAAGGTYDLEGVLAAAETASSRRPEDVARLKELGIHADPALRYWAAVGFLVQGETAVRAHAALLKRLSADTNNSVRVPAAEALARWGRPEERQAALETLLILSDSRRTDYFVTIAALNALDAVGPLLAYRTELAELPKAAAKAPERAGSYPARLLEHILKQAGP